MNSNHNPAERAMALLNLALYVVGTMRQPLPPDLEKIVTGLNSMKAIRQAATTAPGLKEANRESLQPVKQL